jgi:hypothetical protein
MSQVNMTQASKLANQIKGAFPEAGFVQLSFVPSTVTTVGTPRPTNSMVTSVSSQTYQPSQKTASTTVVTSVATQPHHHLVSQRPAITSIATPAYSATVPSSGTDKKLQADPVLDPSELLSFIGNQAGLPKVVTSLQTTIKQEKSPERRVLVDAASSTSVQGRTYLCACNTQTFVLLNIQFKIWDLSRNLQCEVKIVK